MNEITIKRFNVEDYQEMIDLWELAGLEKRPGDDLKSILRKIERDPQLFLLAWSKEGRIIGTIIGAYDGRRGWIYHLSVHPKYRRNGIGKLLMNQVEAELKLLHCPLVFLLVDEKNIEAITFYESSEYEMFNYQLMGKDLRAF